MPTETASRPHVDSCIKWSIVDLLKAHCENDLTISCDRADCWSDYELFKYRQAVNVANGGQTILGQKTRKGGRKLSEADAPDQCVYDAQLDITLQIYVEDCECDGPDCEQCDTPMAKALAILAHLTHVMCLHQDSILGHRVVPNGYTPIKDLDGELDLVILAARFDVHYLFDPCRPWAVL